MLRSAASIVLLAAGLISYWFNATATPDGPFGSLYGRGDAAFAALNAASVLPIHVTGAVIVLITRPQRLAWCLWWAAFLGIAFAALFGSVQVVAALSQVLSNGAQPEAAGVAVVLFTLYAVACAILWADRPQHVTAWLEARHNDRWASRLRRDPPTADPPTGQGTGWDRTHPGCHLRA